jgi:hypothetical protein
VTIQLGFFGWLFKKKLFVVESTLGGINIGWLFNANWNQNSFGGCSFSVFLVETTLGFLVS